MDDRREREQRLDALYVAVRDSDGHVVAEIGRWSDRGTIR